MSDFDAMVAQVLQQHAPGYQELTSVERLSGGASQETYRLVIATDKGSVQYAMRRAPGGVPSDTIVGHPGLDVEALLMQSAHAVGVPEPEVLYVLQETDGLGAGFIMQWLEGEALGARIARASGFAELREHLAYDCGRILAQIHAIDLKTTGIDQRLESIEPEAFVHQMWDRYKTYNTPQPMIDYAARWLLENLPKNPRSTLVHNDFRNGNVMVDESKVVAVLDWEVAHIGDPMRDLGWICTNSWRFGVTEKPVGGFGAYEDLFRGYQDESGLEVDPEHVRFWEVFGSYWWAVGCLGMAEHYRTGPDQTVERPAIGRRTSECQVDCVNLIIPGPVDVIDTQAPVAADQIDMPTLDELLLSVRDFLHQDVMAETEGRLNFMSRVAGNSLDIVRREVVAGAQLRSREVARLSAMFPQAKNDATDLAALRWRLVNGLRDGSIDLNADGLQHYLREAVVNQVGIDQPKYTGFKTACRNAGLV